MKKYIKPAIDTLSIDVTSEVICTSGFGTNDKKGNGTQLSKERIILEEEEDEEDLDW